MKNKAYQMAELCQSSAEKW